MFEYYGYIHVYCPGTETEPTQGPIIFHKYTYSVYLPIPSKFSAFKGHLPPTLKKFEGHIAFGLSLCVWVGEWVCAYVC